MSSSKAATALWQLRVGDDGSSSEDVDTVSLAQLPEPYDSDSTLEMVEGPGVDPYSNVPAPTRLREHRRSLDDMRKLDEEIKRARAVRRSAEHSTRTTAESNRLFSPTFLVAIARWIRRDLP